MENHSSGKPPGIPGQDKGMGWLESYEVQQNQMQGLACGTEQPPALLQAGDWLSGDQLCTEADNDF